jgi:hypothetical protein
MNPGTNFADEPDFLAAAVFANYSEKKTSALRGNGVGQFT